MLNRRDSRKIFEELIGVFDEKKSSEKSPGRLAIEIGRFFLGTPYVAGTLDVKKPEQLIVNLREFDCVTFVETVVALTWLIGSGKRSFESFEKLLRKVRYRQGRLQGYSSRLHYFSDWIHDNQKKGIVRNVTKEIGGRPLKKAITFMTTNPDLYLSLRDEKNLRGMKSVERSMNRRSLCYIPKEGLRPREDQIRDGDLVAVTTHAESLDVKHVGFATRVNHRIRLLHASAKEGKVILSRQTLYRYLIQNKVHSGIIVTRIQAKP